MTDPRTTLVDLAEHERFLSEHATDASHARVVDSMQQRSALLLRLGRFEEALKAADSLIVRLEGSTRTEDLDALERALAVKSQALRRLGDDRSADETLCRASAARGALFSREIALQAFDQAMELGEAGNLADACRSWPISSSGGPGSRR
jgi:hypothetical protein